MRLVFAGTPEFAIKPLRAIFGAGHEIAKVLTQPDRPQGRKGILTPSPVKREAERLNISVMQPERLREDFGALKESGAPLMVTCAYGQILSKEILDLFPLGVWNIHASLLPAYRGAAPIARAILDGCTETGVTIMRTELGLDTGDILLSERIPIERTDTEGSLSEKLSVLGAELIVSALKEIEAGASLKKQGDGFVCKKVARTEVDFSKNAEAVSCLIRGLSPAPLAYARIGTLVLNFYFAEDVPCDADAPFGTILSASPKEGLVVKCGRGAVKITELQAAGGKRMSARDFLNGRKLEEGQCFENQPIL